MSAFRILGLITSTILIAIFFQSCNTTDKSEEKGQSSKVPTNESIKSEHHGVIEFERLADEYNLYHVDFPSSWKSSFELKTHSLNSETPVRKDGKLDAILKIDARKARLKYNKESEEMEPQKPNYRDEARMYLENLKRSVDNLQILDSGSEKLGGEAARYLKCSFNRKEDKQKIETRVLISNNAISSVILTYSYNPDLLDESDEAIWKRVIESFQYNIPQ